MSVDRLPLLGRLLRCAAVLRSSTSCWGGYALTTEITRFVVTVDTYSTPDTYGYLRLAPSSEQGLELHATEDEAAEVISGSTALTSGALLTLFVVGGKTDDSDIPSHLLVCDDKTGSGYLGTCLVVSDL